MKANSENITKRAQEAALAAELFELVESRKRLQKREEELKELFRENYGLGANNLGEFVVVVKQNEKHLLDREKLEATFGKSEVEKCKRISISKTVTVEKAA